MNNISPEDISLFKSVTCQDDNKARIFLLRYPDVSTAIAQYFLAQETNPSPAVENSQTNNHQPPESIPKVTVSNFVRRSKTEVPAKPIFFSSQGNSQEPKKPQIFELNPDESSLSASLPEESEIEEEDEDFEPEEENILERSFMKPTQELTLPVEQPQGGSSPAINDNVAQFIAITDCDRKTAQDYLNRFRDLDIAMDAFFNKESGETSTKNTTPYPQKSFSPGKESTFQPIKGPIWQPAKPANPSFSSSQPQNHFNNFGARRVRGRRNRRNQWNAPVQIGGSRLKANLPLKLRGGDYKQYVKKYTKPGQPLNEAHQWPKYLGSLLVDCTINTQETLSNIKINDELKFAPEDIEFTATNIKKKKKNKDGQLVNEVVGKNWYIKGNSLMVQCLWKGRMVGYLSCDFEEIFVFLLSKNYIFLEGTVVHNSFNASSPLSAYFNTVTAQIDVFLTEEVLKNPLNIISVPGRKRGGRARKQNDRDEIQTKEEQQMYQTLRLAKESFVKLFAMLKINVSIPTIVQLRQRIDPFQRIKREKYGLTRRGRKAYMRMGLPAESIPNDFPDYYKNSHNNGLAANIAPVNKPNPLALSSDESDFDEEDDEDDMDWNEHDDLSDNSDPNPWKRFTKPAKSLPTTEISMTKPMEMEAKEPGDEENNKANQDLLGTGNQAASYYVASEPPSTLKSELHPYQKQALSWMKHREGKLGRDELFESTFEEQRLLNDLFQEMILLDGSKLYFNPFNGEICVDFPTVKTCKGGILADEMGLGKTVMTIALIHSHKRSTNNLGIVQEEVEDDEDEEEDSEENGLLLTKAKDEDDEDEFVPKTVEKKKTTRRRGRGRRGKESSDEDDEEEDEIPTAKKITRSNSNKDLTIKDFFQKSKTTVDVGSKRGAKKDLDFDDFFSDEDEENDFSEDAKSAIKGSTKKLKDNNSKAKVTNKKKEDLMGLWALEDDDEDDFTPAKKKGKSAKSTSSTEKKKATLQKEKKPMKKAAPKKLVTKRYTGTLIVVPLTVLPQWETEIQKHSNPNTVSVLQYYGNGRRKADFQDYDVILTTYGILESEYSDHLNKKESQLFSCEWFRVILDEAHYIKGRQTKTTKAAHALGSEYRWCLTGTPLQNKLDDMFSLLQFLRLDTWGEYFWWNTYINKYTSHDEAAKLIRGILKPIILRRTKKSTYLDGRNILELPKKEINNVFVKLTHEERAIYNGFFQGSKKQFNEMVSSGTLQYEYAHVFELLIRLRQVCDHPSLVFTKDDLKTKENLDKAIYKFLEKRMQSSLANNPAFKDKKKDSKRDNMEEEEKGDNSMMKSEFITKTIERLKNKELEPCCICLEDITNPAIANCGHIFCKDCLAQSLKTTKKCPLCQNEISASDVMSISLEDQETSKSLLDINSSNFKKSSKLEAVINAAKEVAQRGEKVVIFSQFIAMLGLIERFLKEENIGYRRIDGSTTMKNRADNIEAFNTERDVSVFLISLKAGAIGLNLTAAQNVYLVDPWWNPAVEDQAIERVHRIGQRNQVQVKRFVCEKTIEERILQLNEQKKDLINRILQYNPQEQKKQNMENMIYVMKGFDDE